MKPHLIFVVILHSSFAICETIYAQEKVIEIKKDSLTVKVEFEESTWNIFLSNNGQKKTQYILNDKTRAPRDLGIEFWDQEKKKGRRVYIGNYGVNKRDGFGMNVQFIEPGETIKFKIDFLAVSSSEKENLESWRRLSQSGYCYCRVFFNAYASPMYPVLFKDNKTQK